MKLRSPFLILNKHIELDVYFAKPYLEGLNLVDSGYKHKKWWMKRPKEYKTSISTCVGLLDLQRKGVSIKSWTDFNIVNSDGEFDFSGTSELNVSSHTSDANGWAEKNDIKIAKLVSPFVVQCNEETNFLLTQSPFCKQDICMPSGILNFKYQHQLNIFLYLHQRVSSVTEVRLGDFLVNLQPLSDRPVKVNYMYNPERHFYLGEKSKGITVNNYRKLNFLRKNSK
jgi:hypothetical protein